MAKKIYDIKPPRVAKKTEHTIKEFLAEDKKKKVRAKAKKESSFKLPPITIIVGVFALFVCAILFFKLPKADITIWPKVETLTLNETITADKSADAVDSVANIVPAKYFEASKTLAQDFPATGNASNEGQASGTITVYNKNSPATSMTLKEGTRFLSDSGKLFITSQKIVVPAPTKSGSKITPGSIKVKVKAVEGGESYNIAPANFSVPGLKGTVYYFSIYASSSEAMAGGYAGKVKKVSDDDIQSAKDVIIKKLNEETIGELKKQISSDYVLLDNAVSYSTIDASTKTKAGTIAENFNYQGTVKASALAFKKADVENLAKAFVVSQVPEGKTLLDGSLKIDYSSTTIDVSGGKATLNLAVSSGVYKNIDKNSIVVSLFGKNKSQMSETINSTLGVQASKVEIKLWPFWVTSAPNNQKAVHVEFKF